MPVKDRWQSRAGKLICAAIVLGGIYLALKYALGIILPLLVAWAVAAAVSSAAKKCSLHLKGSVKAWSIFFVAIVWGAIAIALALLVKFIGGEAGEFFSYLESESETIAQRLKSLADAITSLPKKIPILKGFFDGDEAGEKVNGAVGGLLTKIAQKGSELLASGAGRLVVSTPRAVISIVICIMSSIYLALDYEKIKEYLLGILSPDSREKTGRLLKRITKGLRGYARAYFFLFLINFTVLYIGLAALRREYAFLVALALAFFDLLPLFGAGIVLVPWALILMLGGNYAIGIGMLVLVGVMTVVRQIAEPRLVGESLGIHPLASLVSMFVGFRAFGFWGMMLAPVGVLVVKELLEERRERVKE